MKLYKNSSLISLFLCLAIDQSAAKNAYDIKVKINGCKDKYVLLGNYFMDGKQYLQDTGKVDSRGIFVINGKDKLPRGMYFILLQNQKNFQIIITEKEQNFSIETDTADFVRNMKVKGSSENELFYSSIQFIGQKQKEDGDLRKQFSTAKNKSDTAETQRKLDVIRDELKNRYDALKKDHAGTFVVKFFKASEDIIIPETPKLSNGRPDSTFAYRYYKAHYFDNIDFSDEGMIRTPMMNGKITYYLDNLTSQAPDSLNASCDVLVEKARANKEFFKIMTHYLTVHYEVSKIMGMEGVFVHLVEKYYMTNQAYWVDSSQLAKMSERAMLLKPLLLGKKTGNLTLEDTNKIFRPLYDVKAKYTLLFFWDPDCGHCQKAIPKILEVYEKYKPMGLEVYASCVDTDVAKWKKTIREKNLKWINVADLDLHNNFRHDYDVSSTPQIFLVDENKIIKAKRLDADQLADIFEKLLVEKKNIFN